MESVVELGCEQTDDQRWLNQWLSNWDALGNDPRAYTKKRTSFQQLVKMGCHIPAAHQLVVSVVRALGSEATEYVQLAYVQAGSPPIKKGGKG